MLHFVAENRVGVCTDGIGLARCYNVTNMRSSRGYIQARRHLVLCCPALDPGRGRHENEGRRLKKFACLVASGQKSPPESTFRRVAR